MDTRTQTAEQQNTPAIEVKGLRFCYEKNIPVFDDVSFSLDRGEILQILGANGSGKTTLMNCLVHQSKSYEGTVRMNGRDPETLDLNERARYVAYVPQIQTAACAFRVLDYVVMGRSPHIGLLASPKEADYEMAERIIRELRLTALRDKRLDQLSGGELQQVRIARALTQESDILLLDEPTNHLDYGVQHRIWDLVVYLAGRGKTIISTTHIPDSPLMTGGKAGIFLDGKFIFGDAEELITGEMLHRIYHVNAKVIWIDDIDRKACFCVGGQNEFTGVS